MRMMQSRMQRPVKFAKKASPNKQEARSYAQGYDVPPSQLNWRRDRRLWLMATLYTLAVL